MILGSFLKGILDGGGGGGERSWVREGWEVEGRDCEFGVETCEGESDDVCVGGLGMDCLLHSRTWGQC
jgi:hypothetical protein